MNFGRFFAVLILSLSYTVSSVASAELVEGEAYTRLLNPQPTLSNDKIEVLEFFWYGCPHCNDLHPHIKTWLEEMAEDVSFRYVPTIFRTNWVPGAKAFYVIDMIGEKENLHDKIYDAIHRDKIDLSEESELFDWVEKQGIERDIFVNAYNSFAVQNQVAKSTQMSRDYKLSGVPSIVVDGTYLTSGTMGGTPEGTIKILNKLIDKVREDRESISQGLSEETD
jgi:thiol:disulfide interchange protein DsbA